MKLENAFGKQRIGCGEQEAEKLTCVTSIRNDVKKTEFYSVGRIIKAAMKNSMIIFKHKHIIRNYRVCVCVYPKEQHL